VEGARGVRFEDGTKVLFISRAALRTMPCTCLSSLSSTGFDSLAALRRAAGSEDEKVWWVRGEAQRGMTLVYARPDAAVGWMKVGVVLEVELARWHSAGFTPTAIVLGLSSSTVKAIVLLFTAICACAGPRWRATVLHGTFLLRVLHVCRQRVDIHSPRLVGVAVCTSLPDQKSAIIMLRFVRAR
jgi:hypothetical protein